MTNIIAPENGILFMKVGVHAKEDLESIIARKTKEIDDTGYALWGYGGNTCHPSTMVQPFARARAAAGKPIFLCMHEMNSKHFAEQIRADLMSIDGNNWTPIPDTINVVGSRYALAIKNLRRENLQLPIGHTQVAIGRSAGKRGHQYLIGQSDKACLELVNPELRDPGEEEYRSIELVAELCDPYAVFLKTLP